MSLEVAAKYLAAHGRGPDDQLVHMSRKEVAGLESIAKAMGGSLTTNPHTGLTEAGFLDDVAPLVIGAGLAVATGGTSLGMELAGSEMLAGLSPEILGTIGGLSNAAIIGGGMGLTGLALSGGNLGQGLRYGLGGYGGASLATAGMNYMNQPTAPTPIDTAAANPGGAQTVNTQVAPAGAPTTSGPTLQEGTRFEGAMPDGTPAVQPAVNTPYGPVYNTNIPPEGVLPPAATSEMSAAQASKLIADEQAASSSYFDKALGFAKEHPYITAAGVAAPFLLKKPSAPTGTSNPQMIRPHTYTRNAQIPANMVGTSYVPGQDTSERQWFNPYYTAQEPYKAANGGIIALAGGGMPVEQMSTDATLGTNIMYPMANMTTSSFATPYQTPQSTNMMANMAPSGGGTVNMMSGEPNMQGTRMAAGGMAAGGDTGSDQMGGIFNKVLTPAQAVRYSYNPSTQAFTQTQASTPARTYGTAAVDTMTGVWNAMHPDAPIADVNAPATTPNFSFDSQTGQFTNQGGPASGYYLDPQTGQYAQRVMASGGITNLGGYSDGGRLLRGPGDGVSDSIPAQIGVHQPARLADGEFVVPARIVSELGNGSTEAGARQLYKMLDRVQNARGKTTAKGKVAHNTNAAKYLPA